jgi:hypothetical protein
VEELNNKILNKNKFSIEVEKTYMQNLGISYLDALLIVVESLDIEAEKVPRLLSDNLKAKLHHEALEFKLIKGKKINKLPI